LNRKGPRHERGKGSPFFEDSTLTGLDKARNILMDEETANGQIASRDGPHVCAFRSGPEALKCGEGETITSEKVQRRDDLANERFDDEELREFRADWWRIED